MRHLAFIAIISLAFQAVAQAPPALLQPFDLGDVKLFDGPFKNGFEKNRAYLLSFDNDRLLYNFRKNASLAAPGEPYGGWEAPSCEVRGHFVGHYLSACAMTARATGDEKLRERGAQLVAELAKCQAALGGRYLSAYPEAFLDRFEAGKPVWAPYYTLHKILAGLLDQYELCGNAQALDVAKGMGAWIAQRNARFTPKELNDLLDKNEQGGTDDALWRLWSITKDPALRAISDKFEHRSFLDPMARGEDVLAGRHGNTHIPLVLGAARRYELTGESRYADAAAFFWDRVVTARSYATGGSTNDEHWGPAFQLAGTFSNTNHETCKTYNMLKLTRELFRWTGSARYADFYERALYNGILGTQDPADGMLEYYVPMAPGNQRVYGTPYDAFWCCTGTGVETWSKIGDSIYFHNDDTVYVNLFVPSEVTWKERGVTLSQVTRFPEEDFTEIAIKAEKPVSFALAVRVPGWVAEPVKAQLNRESVNVDAAPGSYWTIDRRWKNGDTLRVEFPMGLHAMPLPDAPETVALLDGPIVLAGIVDDTPPKALHSANPAPQQPEAEVAPHPYFLSNDVNDLSWLQPDRGKPLHFHVMNQPFKTAFQPFYETIRERYAIYFPIAPAGSDRANRLEAEERERPKNAEEHRKKVFGVFDDKLDGEVDRVIVGDDASERAHNLHGDGTQSGDYWGRHWRHATSEWSWTLNVKPDAPMALTLVYLGNEVGRVFDVLVDGHVIATQTLNNNHPGVFFRETYAIPAEITRKKERVTVTFHVKQGLAGGVFACSITAAK